MSRYNNEQNSFFNNDLVLYCIYSYGDFLWLKIVKNWVFFSYDAFLWLKMGIHRSGQVLNSANVYLFITMVLFYD